jgi:hypothetical protein
VEKVFMLIFHLRVQAGLITAVAVALFTIVLALVMWALFALYGPELYVLFRLH